MRSRQVAEVAYSEGEPKVAVTSDKGETITAERVIVCVPQNILRDAEIKFHPAVPPQQAQALAKISMGNAMKIVVKLSKRVWPDDLWDCVCADSFIPEVRPPSPFASHALAQDHTDGVHCTSCQIWVSPAAAVLSGEDMGGEFIIVGFVAGSRADRLRDMSKEHKTRLMLSQLDAMFGSQNEPNPASKHFVDSMVKDWGVDPLFRGAYSHPTVDGREARVLMSTPLGNRVFFAGEAMNANINPCINGAMESASAATKAVMQSIHGPKHTAKL